MANKPLFPASPFDPSRGRGFASGQGLASLGQPAAPAAPMFQGVSPKPEIPQMPFDPSNGRGYNSGMQSPFMAPTNLAGISEKPPMDGGYVPPPWAKPPTDGGYQAPPWSKPPTPGGYEPPPWAGGGMPVKGESVGYQAPPWSQLKGGSNGMAGAPSFGPQVEDSRVNRPGGPTQETFAGTPIQTSAPQAGQFANTNQGFLDWVTQQTGQQGGMVNASALGGLQNALQQYSAATGNTANYMGGPSGDRVDFGQGVQDALTSSGQIWNNENTGAGGPGGSRPDPSNGRGYNSGIGSGGGGDIRRPTGDPSGGRGYDPGMLTPPSPFTYTPSNLGQFQGGSPFGNFQGPSPYQVPSPFSYGGQVPNAPNLQYERQDSPERLQYQQYNGAPGDSSYDFRFDQGLKAAETALAHSGALRSGNAVQALTDYGQGMASTEYAAEDARRRANVGMNNEAALAFGQANIGNQFNATQANNANAMGFGNQNFQNAMASQGQGYNQAAGTYGMNANLGMQAQAQNFGQALAGYGANQSTNNQNFNQSLAGYGANQAAQNQIFNQALAAYGMNANTGLGYGSQNQNYALGQRGLDLGFQNSNNSYNLGMGNLGVAQGQLGLAQQGQNFNQGMQSWEQNYRSQVLDPWNMNYQLASLGNPGAPNGQNYANQTGDLYTQQGNAGAAGQIGQGNASAGMWGNLGLSAQQIAYLQSLNGG